MEEERGSPKDIEILTVNRDTICSYITEYYPPHVKSWAREESKIRPIVEMVEPAAHLKCPNYKKIVAVEFASFGDPIGTCGTFFLGKCNSPISKQIVEQYCLGKTYCTVPMKRDLFDKDKDGCPDIQKILAIQVKCAL